VPEAAHISPDSVQVRLWIVCFSRVGIRWRCVRKVHKQLKPRLVIDVRAWVFCLGGFIAPGTSNHPFAQKALDCAFRYPQNQAPAAVARACRPEPNNTRPVHEVPNNCSGIETEPLSKSRRTVKDFVWLNVLVGFIVHPTMIFHVPRKVNIIEPVKEPVKILTDLMGFADWGTGRAEVLRQ
jgi:hypothetical protein